MKILNWRWKIRVVIFSAFLLNIILKGIDSYGGSKTDCCKGFIKALNKEIILK